MRNFNPQGGYPQMNQQMNSQLQMNPQMNMRQPQPFMGHPFQMFQPGQPNQNPMMNMNMMFPGQHLPFVTPPMPQPQPTPKTFSRDIEWIMSNRKEFDSYSSDEKKKILGSILYNLVFSKIKDKDMTPKITGMLIDLEVLTVSEIIDTITNPQLLAERVEEAIQLIREEGNQ